MARTISALGALAVLLPLFAQAYPTTGAPASQQVGPTDPQVVGASGNAPGDNSLLAAILDWKPNKDGQPQPSTLLPGDGGEGRDGGKEKGKDKDKGNKGKGNGKGKEKGKGKGKKKEGKEMGGDAKAIYFITNDAIDGNAIVAMKVGADGKLSDGSVTKTGGKGGIGMQKGAPATVDPLFSQSAVRVGAGHIMAVNAGSNTLSLFKIDPTDPTKLAKVGNDADTLGEFPVSVAFSEVLMMACVANTGAKSGVSCYSVNADKGLISLDQDGQRALDINQTTPPNGPEGTVSHVLFNEDSSLLLTTVKGDPTKPGQNGFISAFPVQDGVVSRQETRSSPSGTAVLFGTANVDATTIVATDASFGAATLTRTQQTTPQFTLRTKTAIANQKATCWAAFSPLTKTVFVTDVGVNHLVEIDPADDGTIVAQLELANGNQGMIDLVAAGRFVYALSPGNATKVAVFDVSAGRGLVREVQNFEVALGAASGSSMGMTAFF